jgi:hypothetical protein
MGMRIVFLIIAVALVAVMPSVAMSAPVVTEGGKVYIVDRTGERWDVTQAESLGFKPEKFQYGLGRDAFKTLDDSLLTSDSGGVRPDLRIIGISEGDEAKAYSVRRLSRHEVSNSLLAEDPVAVAY